MAIHQSRFTRFEFEQYVSTAGYCVVNNNEEQDQLLLSGRPYQTIKPISISSPYIVYEPMRDFPVLYREFAALAVPIESYIANPNMQLSMILQFINKYGLIFGKNYSESLVLYDIVHEVMGAIDVLALAIMLYDAYENRDMELFSRIGRIGNDKEPLTIQDAMSHLATVITFGLQPQVRADIRIENGENPAIRVGPTNLLGVMWLQLAQQFTGEKTYRKCSFCDTWFPIGAGDDSSKGTRLYCSDSCRLKAYRRRKKQSKM